MIPLAKMNDLTTYAFVGGMRNVVWQVGIVGEIAPDRRSLVLIRKEGDALGKYPMALQEGDKLPEAIKVGTALKTICHLYGKEGGDVGEVELRVIGVEQPNLIEVRTTVLFQPGDAEKAEAAALETRFTELANAAEIAGFVFGAPALESRGDDRKKDKLTILVKQGQRAANLVKLELVGKFAQQYKQNIKPLSPLFAQCEIVSETVGDKTVLSLRTKHLRTANFGEHIKGIPEWLETERKTQQEKLLAAMAEAE